jgi:type 1 glutamine amidotransferase
MKRRDALRLSGGSALSLLMPRLRPVEAGAPSKTVLFFTRSQGYEHSVIARKGNAPSLAEEALQAWLSPLGIRVVASKDGGLFTTETLSSFDGFVFFTTGDLTKPGGDGNPPMSAEGKAAFLDLVREGRGFVGIHSATDTFPSPGARTDPAPPKELDPYVAMLGGEFILHNAQQEARARVVDHAFPGMGGLGDALVWTEEWYSLRNFAKDLHVLLVMETEGMVGNTYERPPYPNTWARLDGKGRVFYTALGHREDVWSNPLFRDLLTGGILFALGMREAKIPPNLPEVTPKADAITAGLLPPPPGGKR